MASSVYEPSPRLDHSSIQVQDNAYLWGGFTQDSSRSEVINIFDSYVEMWKEQSTTGVPPPGLDSTLDPSQWWVVTFTILEAMMGENFSVQFMNYN